MKKALLLVMFVAGFFLVADAQVETEIIQPDNNIVFSTDEIEGVIFGENYKHRHGQDSTGKMITDPMKVFTRKEGAERFQPTVEEVLALESKLKEHMTENHFVIGDSLSYYVKQYFGYIDENGDKIIYINCFWNKEIRELGKWKVEMVVVFEGWFRFFNIRYNVTKDEFYNLWINTHE